MADTTFTNGVTLTDEDWFNDVNRLHYTIFGDPADATAARNALPILTVGSAVATTSGTSVAVSTTIPSWAKKLTLAFSGVSLSGTADILVQIGPSGGLDTSGYLAESAIVTAASTGVSSSTAGFIVRVSAAASVLTGRMDINLTGTSNQWIASHTGRNNTTSLVLGGGSVTASGTVTRISLVSSNGSDTFDAGAVTLIYE